MKVLAFDPYAKDLLDYIELAGSREEVFEKADYVSLHVPATPETVNSVGAKEFQLMKPTAFLINTSRGTVVDEEALIEALKERETDRRSSPRRAEERADGEGQSAFRHGQRSDSAAHWRSYQGGFFPFFLNLRPGNRRLPVRQKTGVRSTADERYGEIGRY